MQPITSAFVQTLANAKVRGSEKDLQNSTTVKVNTRTQRLKKFGIAVVLPFPSPPSASLLSSPLPFASLLSPPLPLEVGPPNPATGSGERCKFPQRGLGRSPSRNRFLVHFSPHLVAKILMIFLRINLPIFMYFEVSASLPSP